MCVNEGYNRCFFRLGQEAVQNVVGVVLDKKNSFSSVSYLSSSRVLNDRG